MGLFLLLNYTNPILMKYIFVFQNYLMPKLEDIFIKASEKGEGNVAGASQRHQIQLHTSCDVPAPLNQLRATTFDQRAPTFVLTLVSFPDLKHFPKMLPGRS